MTHYEKLIVERSRLTARRTTVLTVLTLLTSLGIYASILIGQNGTKNSVTIAFFSALLTLFAVPWIWNSVLRNSSVRYKSDTERLNRIRSDIQSLREKIRTLFAKYPNREKGKQFKREFDLQGKSVGELEETLAVAMFKEVREVYVTAFMRKGTTVRVTAAVGSARRCRPADNPRKWVEHLLRLSCDEIRQYHNHPSHTGITRPSDMDVQSSKMLRMMLGTHSEKLRSFIIHWNEISEWKILEYDHNGNHRLLVEFDVSISDVGARMSKLKR